MKTIFVILDGVVDRECKALKGKTPLEAAYTPNIDWFAKEGKQGVVAEFETKSTPESHERILALFGYSPHIVERGVLEAIGCDIKLKHGDLALRTNFATIKSIADPIIIDRRVGRTLTTKEANILAKEINKKLKLPYKFIFKATIQHRGVLVIRGGFSDNITDTDRTYSSRKDKDKLNYAIALDDDETSELSANLVNEFIEQSYFILKNHPINKYRKNKGLLPANIVLTRGAGSNIPEIKKLSGKWAAIVSMPLEKGIAKLLGMQVFSFPYPPLRNYDVYSNLYEGLNTTISFAKKVIRKNINKYTHFYIHFKETDLPGHDGRAEDKKKMIEIIDSEFFSFIREITKKEKIRLVVTSDHATPCDMKIHTSDNIPIMVYGEGSDNTKRFTEKESKRGKLSKLNSKEIIKFLISE